MNGRTLREVLAAHAAGGPDRPFLVAPETGRVLRYGEIERQARNLARFLASRGLRRGDKVALYLPNGYQATLLFLSAMAGGFVVVPLNLVAQRSQLAYVLGHCGCKLLFTSRDYEAPLAAAMAEAKRGIEAITIDPDAAELFVEKELPKSKLEKIRPTDPALLMYTSGTTGVPKGVLLTQANLVAGASSVARWHGLTRADRCLSSLPLYHINGQVIATLTPFVSGGSVIAPHRFSVSTWWEAAEKHGATWINMVPTIVAYLLNAAGERRRRFPRIRFGRSASAPLAPEQHRAFEAAFGMPVIECMGMTETASVCFANPQEGERRIGSVGLPCGIEARVTEGEIQLRGPNVMSGYYRSRDQTAAAFAPGGWLRTGDLGRRDADGFYYITGRRKELIIKGGENIAPREIDEALLRHPAILEAASVGIADANYGQEIMACVVLKAERTCSVEELRDFCLTELGAYKTPKVIRFVEALPKGPSGKVQRLKLLDS